MLDQTFRSGAVRGDDRETSGMITPVVARTSSPVAICALIVVMFLGPWLIWGTRLAQVNGLISWRLPQGLALWILLPSVAVTVAVIGGRSALMDLGRRLIRWRVPAAAYVAALATPPAIAFASVALTGEPVPLGSVMSASGALVYLLYGIPLFLLTEEAGWRGAVLPRLQFRSNPLAASLLLGVIWSIWHLPILSIPDEGDYGISPVGFAVLVISTSVLITALVNFARGSVLVVAIFHAVFDATYSYTGVVGGGSDTLFWTTAGLTACAAVAVTAVTRGRLFAH